MPRSFFNQKRLKINILLGRIFFRVHCATHQILHSNRIFATDFIATMKQGLPLFQFIQFRLVFWGHNYPPPSNGSWYFFVAAFFVTILQQTLEAPTPYFAWSTRGIVSRSHPRNFLMMSQPHWFPPTIIALFCICPTFRKNNLSIDQRCHRYD